MSSYEVNADDLFSNDSDVEEPSTPDLHPPSPKRHRPNPTASRFPSFNPTISSTRNVKTPGSYPSFNPNQSYSNPSRPSIHPPTNRFPSFNARQTAAPHRNAVSAPVYRSTSTLGPMGRGRGATLPAHVTGVRPTSVVAEPKPVGAGSMSSSQKQPDHVSIIPEHLRERFLKEEARKKAAAAASSAQRKRPGVRHRRDGSASGDSRRSSSMSNGRVTAASAGNKFGLQNLLAAAAQSKSSSLIRLDPERGAMRKVKRSDVGSVYKAVSMTKEAREREERLRQEENLRRQGEAEELAERYARKREMERKVRAEMAARWKREPTVAEGMRMAHYMAKAERSLFGRPQDKKKMDTLEYLGMRLIPLVEDEQTTKLLTIEVIQI